MLKQYCGKEGCLNKSSELNKYCGKHQLCLFVDECLEEKMKPCKNYIKGCRTKLDENYKYVRCDSCLEKERCRDKERRQNVCQDVKDGKKQCSVCCQIKPIEEFVGDLVKETKTCSKCRESFKKQELNRDKDARREMGRIYDAKPNRILLKKTWVENNRDKVNEINFNYRARQINENPKEYLQKKAEMQKQWRMNNPDKMYEINKKNKENIEYSYHNYAFRSEENGKLFELTLEQFESIVKEGCYYCGIIQDKGFNGIDRVCSKNGYIIGNCVSCCKICNFIKGSLDVGTFIKRVEHILFYNKIIENGNLWNDAFANSNCISYKSYKDRARNKNLEFTITEEDHQEITNQDCYICGKKSSNIHKNGLDRIDNSMGYTLHNIKPSCFECNVMKKTMTYENLIDKLKLIYKTPHNLDGFIIYPNNKIIMRNENKKSKLEKEKNILLRKEARMQTMLEKYSIDK
jgi:hypothetical protein